MKVICPTLPDSSIHKNRTEIINYLISKGVNVDTTHYWGVGYYNVIKDADVVLNVHGDAIKEACNLRLFQTTGMGTCLLTDNLPGLEKLFNKGTEVVTFNDKYECYNQIVLLEAHPIIRNMIAKAGQRRTLQEHTTKKRWEEWDEICR